MKDILWLNNLRDDVFSDLEAHQFNAMWNQLHAVYTHGIENRKNLG